MGLADRRTQTQMNRRGCRRAASSPSWPSSASAVSLRPCGGRGDAAASRHPDARHLVAIPAARPGDHGRRDRLLPSPTRRQLRRTDVLRDRPDGGGAALHAPSVALVGPCSACSSPNWFLVRSVIKAVFNLSSNAIATSVLVVTYTVLDGPADRLSTRSVLALLVAAALAWSSSTCCACRDPCTRSKGWASRTMAQPAVADSAHGGGLGRCGDDCRRDVSDLAHPRALRTAPGRGVVVRLQGHWRPTGRRRSEPSPSRSSRASSRQRAVRTDCSRWPPDGCAGSSVPTKCWPPSIAKPSCRTAATARRGTRSPPGTGLLDSVPHRLRRSAGHPQDRLPQGWTSGYNVPLDVGDRHAGMVALGAYGPPRGLDRILPWAKGSRAVAAASRRPTDLGKPGRFVGKRPAGAQPGRAADETMKLTAVVDHATDGIAGVRQVRTRHAVEPGVGCHDRRHRPR